MTIDPKLDQTDARILEHLQREGRVPYAELGAEIGLSAPSTHERVKKLEGRGVVTGYGAAIDPAAVGLGVLAFMWVTQAPGTMASDLSADFAAIAEIEACHRIAGEGDYLLKIRAGDTADLERVVRQVQLVRHVYRTETDVVFSTAFEGRPLPIGRTVARAVSAAGGSRWDAGEPLPHASGPSRHEDPEPGAVGPRTERAGRA